MDILDNFVYYIDKMFPKSKIKKIDFNDEIKKKSIFLNQSRDVACNFLIKFNNYLKFLANFNKKINKRYKYSKYFQKQFDFELNQLMMAAYLFENKLSLVDRKKVRELFRKNISNFIFQSLMIKRFYEKPQGYAGDYLMFEMMYDGKPLSKGIGRYFDMNILNHPLTKAIIERKNLIKHFLNASILSNSYNTLEILNIGSGSAREIKELLDEHRYNKKILFTFADQDNCALDFAKNKLSFTNNRNINFNFLTENIIKLIYNKTIEDTVIEKDKKDIIYSIGLVDYLHDNMFERFLKFYYNLLKSNGRFIITSCSSENPEIFAHLRWFTDWEFCIRDMKSISRIIRSSLTNCYFEIIQTRCKNIYFIIVTKNK